MTWQVTVNQLVQQALDSHTSESFSAVVKPYQEQIITSDQWQSLHSVIPPRIHKSVVKRQSSFYFGRLCAETALQQIQQASPIEIGERGEPIWPKGVLGSISHTDTLAIVVLTAAPQLLGIGIDVEPILKEADTEHLFNNVLTQNERDQLSSWQRDSGLTRAALLTMIFSLKESFYKSIYSQVKQVLGFDAIEVTGIQNETVDFHILAPQVLCALEHAHTPLTMQAQFAHYQDNIVTFVALPKHIKLTCLT